METFGPLVKEVLDIETTEIKTKLHTAFSEVISKIKDDIIAN